MVSAIAEASQTTFIKDRWEYTDFMGEMKYSIGGPTLPGSGNYLPYNIWGNHIELYYLIIEYLRSIPTFCLYSISVYS